MKGSISIFLFLLPISSRGFTVPCQSVLTTRDGALASFTVARASFLTTGGGAADKNEDLSKLASEWKDFEKDLHKVEWGKDEMVLANLAEGILDKALKTVAGKRDEEYDHKATASAKLKHALAEQDFAEARREEAHNDAVGAEDQTNLLEAYDNDYEDMERVRDLSVAHAAQQVEKDTEAILLRAQETAAKAEEEVKDTTRSIKELEQNEMELKEMMKKIYEVKKGLTMEKWRKYPKKEEEHLNELYWNISV